MKLKKLILILACVFSYIMPRVAMAQGEQAPALPEFDLVTKDGFNIITFYNNYESGVKVITVLRSADSNVNFATIGTLPQTKKGNLVYVDAHPMVGKNWYIVKMEFSSGVDFKSNLKSIVVDSAQIAEQKAIVSSEALQKAANQALEESKSVSNAVESQTKEVTYPKSKYVFTNPFTGDINILLNDALNISYKLEFYDANKRKVVTIPRVNENMVILDKRNFNDQGLYTFKLYKNGNIFEEGFVSIY